MLRIRGKDMQRHGMATRRGAASVTRSGEYPGRAERRMIYREHEKR